MGTTKDRSVTSRRVEAINDLIASEGAEAAKTLIESMHGALENPRIVKLYKKVVLESGDDAALERLVTRSIVRNPDDRSAIRSLLDIGKNRPDAISRFIDHYERWRRDDQTGAVWEARLAAIRMARGETDAACAAARSSLDRARTEAVRQEIRTCLSRLFFWHGHLPLAEAVILWRRDGSDLFGSLWDLVSMRRIAAYDETTKTHFRFLIGHPNPWRRQAAVTYLDHLWQVEGASEDLLSLSSGWNRLFDPGDGSFDALQVSLMLEIGQRSRAIDRLRARPAAARHHHSLPIARLLDDEAGLSHLVAEQDRPDVAWHAGLHRHILTATGEFEAEALAVRASIAVVGNSSCDLGLKNGPVIDGHRLIVRFNKALHNASFSNDYGSRTDAHVQPAGGNPGWGPARDARFVIFTAAAALGRNKDWGHARHLMDSGRKIVCVPGEVYADLATRLGAPPSSGLRMCAYLSRILGGPLARESVFGFAMTDQIGPDSRSAHYFEAARPSMHHDWVKERALFDTMVRDRGVAAAG